MHALTGGASTLGGNFGPLTTTARLALLWGNVYRFRCVSFARVLTC
eukprot:COSAG03_NODE_480_length_7581_cov_8.105052_6_plen_46_part_00